MSQMSAMTIHFYCSLHEIWNVRDHICGPGGPAFGVEASQLWARWMLRAEGPKSFRKGYQRLLAKYENDVPRKTYIHALFRDGNKAHFKRRYTFRNGTVVDFCEILFSAVKTWVYGKSRKSSSLLMAVVRIVEGCRQLLLKTYLKHTMSATRATVDRSECWPVVTLFKHCVQHLTSWAVKNLYVKLDRVWLLYDLEKAVDHAGSATGETIVTRRNDGDSFVVRKDCTCWYRNTQCWYQTYTGLPCKHTMLTTIDRLRDAHRDSNERELICKRLVASCHTNWLRITYKGSVVVDYCKPTPVAPNRIRKSTRKDKVVRRFREVASFVPHTLLLQVLHQLESVTLEPKRSIDSDTDSDSSTEEHTNLIASDTSRRTLTRPDLGSLLLPIDNSISFSNPPRDRDRKRRKCTS